MYEGVNYIRLENVLFPVVIAQNCPTNNLKAYSNCNGNLYDCEFIRSNNSCRCICDDTNDFQYTKRYFFTGKIEPKNMGEYRKRCISI